MTDSASRRRVPGAVRILAPLRTERVLVEDALEGVAATGVPTSCG
jgi:hypothetical protein